MRVWIWNPFDDIPGEGPPLRYHTLCRVLADGGHEVTWWSADYSHRRKARRALDPDHAQRRSFALRLLPVRAYPRNVGPARFLSHRDYARGLWETASREIRSGVCPSPDRIVVSLPPLGTAAPAFRLRRAHGCGVVLDVMDAWPETFARLLPGPTLFRRAVGAVLLGPLFRSARRAYRGADRISGVSRAYLALARRRGARVPMHLCYHCSDIGPEPPARFPAKGEPLRLVYIGAMERTYDLPTVLDGMALLAAHGLPVTLDLAGGGSLEPHLRARAEHSGLTGVVSFRGSLDRAALDDLLLSANAGIVPMDPASGVAVPYKAADYAASGLPCLSCLGNELGDLLAEYDAGVPYTLGDAGSFAEAVQVLLRDPDRLARHGKGARALAEARFDRSREYPKWADFILSGNGAGAG